MVEIRLAKSITVGARPADGAVPAVTGSVLEVVALNLDALTGADMIFCEREASRKAGAPSIELRIDLGFHLEVASHASGLAVETIKQLGAADFLRVTGAVRDFLVGTV